ncbi:sensor histidine kinase [Paenibacillus sp. NPDC056722]|uniref:sensor histidine kinase n=1 Tax=Paenibacillus sp. NPDC056722 TaxID=3345924 RepID=UPI00369FA6E1
MDGTITILKRFISTTMLISILLLVLNLLLLGLWIFKGMNEGNSPNTVVRQVAENFKVSGQAYSLAPEAAQLLDQHRAWAMLLDQSGQLVWSHKLPEELPASYSITDVAKFSRSFLMDYPVFVWEVGEGLVVAGYPKHSLAKYQNIYPVGWVEELPTRTALLLIANIVLVLLLSLFIGSRLIRSIHPLTRGIQALADDTEVHVEPVGVLRELAKRINGVSELLKQKRSALISRDEARSNWIAGISHDIRTPLSLVLGYASVLEENAELPEESRHQAGMITRQGEKLRTLISDLNLVSMLEYEMQPLQIKLLRLSALARNAASEYLNNGLAEQFVLEVDIADDGVQVQGDEKLLLRAIANLIQNCINHNPGGCRIVLQTLADTDKNIGRLIVADDGRGIPPDMIPDLLELPYSAKRQRPLQDGHGLGLPMVARIAKAHHGRLILSSGSDSGLSAELELPRHK